MHVVRGVGAAAPRARDRLRRRSAPRPVSGGPAGAPGRDDRSARRGGSGRRGRDCATSAAAPAADVVTAAAPAAPAGAPPDLPGAPSRSGRAGLAVAGLAVAAVVVAIGGVAWIVTHPGAGDRATTGAASAAGAGAAAAPSATPRPTLAAPPGFVAFDVVTCGALGLDGSIDAGGSVVGVADLPSDVTAGLDPSAFSLYAVPSGQGSATPELYLAPRYWTCIRLANEAGDYQQVSLMPTLPVLLEKLGQAPITATEPAGTFACGAPLDAAACRAARALHERPSLATMR